MMTDALVGQQRLQGLRSACSVYGIGDNRRTIHEGNGCEKCENESCNTYCTQKLKPGVSSNARLTDSMACEQLVTIKNGLGSSYKGIHGRKANAVDMSQEESLHTLIKPGKPLQAAQEKPRNVGTNMHTSSCSSDRVVPNHNGLQNDLQAHNMSRSGIKAFTESVPPTEQQRNESHLRSTARFKAKRDERGLCSKSGVPMVIDNRNRYLIIPEMYKGKTSTNNMTTRQHISGAIFKRPMVRQSPHQQKMQPSKINKEHQVFPTAKHDIERNDHFNKKHPSELVDTARKPEIHLQNSSTQSMLEVGNWGPVKYPRHDQYFDNTSLSEHEYATGRPDRQLRNSANHLEQRMTHLKYPQKSQFYNKIITYPSSTKGYPYTSQRETMSIGINHQQYHCT